MRRIAVIPVSQGSLLRTGGCSVLGTELGLGDACAHDARGGCATRDDVAHLVDDLGAAPLLVRERLHPALALPALDELHVGRRAALRVVPREEVDAERVAVEAREGDELPAEAHLGKVPDEGLHLRVGHAGRVPVEGGAEVVGQHLVGHGRADLCGELRSLAQDRLPGLHPDAVRVGGEGDGTLDAVVGGALDAVVAFHGAGHIPVEEDIAGAKARGGRPHLVQGHLQRVLQPLAGVDTLRLQHRCHSIRVGHAAGAVLPFLVRALADRLVQRLDALLRGALDVGVVNGVDVGVDHRGSLGVRASNKDQARVEDVRLQPACDEALDVLPRGDEDLAAHVAALLGARLLVLDVDASRTRLDEHLRQLHDSGESAMAGVGIGDDGVEEVHHRGRGPLLGRPAAALLVLLPVVELLRPEELVHLVRHRVVRVVGHVRPWLVGGRGR
mmetsp:Transcript_35334/g.80253  ORF Transcript_35334/g.80253 Transcript_35334/m.80253 type:complete len:443 (-) Transcript_35334:520-1848(-)